MESTILDMESTIVELFLYIPGIKEDLGRLILAVFSKAEKAL
jgi:hypothetical protein